MSITTTLDLVQRVNSDIVANGQRLISASVMNDILSGSAYIIDNLSSSFDTRILEISGSSYTNGLTKTGSIVKLGGTLIEDTTIDESGKVLTFTNNTVTSQINLWCSTSGFLGRGAMLSWAWLYFIGQNTRHYGSPVGWRKEADATRPAALLNIGCNSTSSTDAESGMKWYYGGAGTATGSIISWDVASNRKIWDCFGRWVYKTIFHSRTTAQRPSTPTNNEVSYNSDLACAEYYDGSAWVTYGDDNSKFYSSSIVTFDRINQYGTSTSPVTGSITYNLSGALGGKVQMMVHNTSSIPTFPSSSRVIGTYVTGSNNIIRFTYIDVALVLVEIF